MWRKEEKLFKVIKEHKGNFLNLNNINDLMFLSVEGNYNNYNKDMAIISFYEKEQYNKIKDIILPIIFNFSFTINNELL